MVEQRSPDSSEWHWVPLGERTNVAGYDIPGGLLYVGRHLRSAIGDIEPALINRDLPVAPLDSPLVGRDLDPAPAYHLISPVARAAYLGWLAGGRRAEVPTGLVLLFCFGLERRVLLDGGDDPGVRLELPAIAAEVRRLRTRYGGDGPELRGAIDRFLDLLELLAAPRTTLDGAADLARAPALRAPSAGRAPAPMALRVALARFAATATPVPANWAGAWARCHPTLPRRNAQVRCAEEFERLFALRYVDRYGAGLVPPDDAPGIRIRYQPACPHLTATLVCREDLPDVLAEPRSTRALGGLIDNVAATLDPYSRWLARFPEGRGSLAAAALLPAELIDRDRGRLGALRVWAEAHLNGQPLAVIDAAEFGAFWSTTTPHGMNREEAAGLITVLALLGIGVEPDVRFGAPALAPGPAVLFRLGRGTADRPGARFRAAAAIARCAAAVAAAAGSVDPQGAVGSNVLATVSELAALLRLVPAEETRLTARLGWLLATGVDVDRLGRQTALLGAAEREVAGRYLISVAVASAPAIGPATITMLTRVYRILGQDRDLLFHRLHERSVATQPTDRPDTRDEPVVIRPADAVTGGYMLPWAAAPPPPTPSALDLDQTAITQKLAESAAVATLLTAIFDADEPSAPVTGIGSGPPGDGTAGIAGLDRAHSQLLHALTARRSWTREEFTTLAGDHGVLPDGALDLLNEAAIDTIGGPLIEGDATLTVNDDVLQELLG